jgi:topoisomerase-4 subunit A
LPGCCKISEGKKFELFPDFQTGGMIDVLNYNEGKRGARVRVRSHIEEVDKKTLMIRMFRMESQPASSMILL